MFGSSTLEVAIGVVFVYLSLSLACTAANELIASLFAWRAQNLAQGIRNLLNYADNENLLAGLYGHPLIRTLYRGKKKLPSYIPSRTFAVSLLDIVAPVASSDRSTVAGLKKAVTDTNKVDQEVKDALLVLIDQADNTLKEAVTGVQRVETALSKVQENVETWFNDSMERVAGWYKRKTQAMIFVLALVFTVGLNVDTIGITKQLSNDSALRAALVAMAEKTAQNPPVVISGGQPVTGQLPEAVTRARFQELAEDTKALEGLGIPLGWTNGRNRPGGSGAEGWPLLGDWVLKIFGLLLTAGAASLGAPFWFDMLNKIITIRSSGKAPEEGQKSPKEVPTPTEVGQSPKEARESAEAFNELKSTISALVARIEALPKQPAPS